MERSLERTRSILIVDDEEGIRHGLRSFFLKKGFVAHEAFDFGSALAVVKSHPIDIAVIDIRLKNGMDGIDLLRELKSIEPDLIEIIITGYGSIDTAVTSMKEGAADYILKPIDNKKLLDAVRKNLEIRELKNENRFLKKELLDRSVPHAFVTANQYLQKTIQKVDKIKDSPVTVLITGESGTGKEVLARYIHFTSNRRQGKFVSINCASLSENLLLSELFGHEKGAFTGAIERQIGKFEMADRGTLFLDEIGDMSLDVQAKLLRVIEESIFERVGGTRQIRVDARIIAATNKDLTRLMQAGRFRDDLYYRINVVSFDLLPLRERPEDIPLLIDHFVKKYHGKYNKPVEGFSSEAVELMASYKWPGNVRELENVVNQAVLLGEGSLVDAADLGMALFFGEKGSDPHIDFSRIKSLKKAMRDILRLYEPRIIEHFLQKNRYNKSKTARDLSITRKTLDDKIQKYNLRAG
jgi:DNA-binding NtrC family response regulator